MIPKFVVDVMLGSLSRWLRLFGFDTLYSNRYSDRELLRISRQEGRILLTKDRQLSKSKLLRDVLFIHSEKLEDQLKEVLLYLRIRGFEIPRKTLRCPLCNGEMLTINKEELSLSDVPEYVAFNNENFYQCRECKKVYWQGSHAKKIEEMRKRILTGMN